MTLLVLIPLFLCWGSFLNVLGYRLVRDENIASPRSQCPSCKQTIAWYDNIPLLSWILLGGNCRHCKASISWLYPFIELLTTSLLTTLYFTVSSTYFPTYFIFFSALIVTIRSDIETMLISRFVTLFLIPLGIFLSYLGKLPITPLQSIAGAILGYGFLYAIATIFTKLTGKHGMGQGDLELLGFIGSFVGIFGCWVSLFFGSVTGSLFGILYLFVTKKEKGTKIPFGPFLAFGAILFVLTQEYMSNLYIYLLG